MPYLWFIIAGLNILSFLLFGYDKRQARKSKRRISEKTLFLVSLPMSSFGSIFAMWSFQHKTRKFPFMIGIPLLLAIQVGVAFRYLI